jgi:hypothetical protein
MSHVNPISVLCPEISHRICDGSAPRPRQRVGRIIVSGHERWAGGRSRLIFPSFAAIAVAYGWGIEAFTRTSTARKRLVDFAAIPLYATFLTSFAGEIAFVAARVLPAFM